MNTSEWVYVDVPGTATAPRGASVLVPIAEGIGLSSNALSIHCDQDGVFQIPQHLIEGITAYLAEMGWVEPRIVERTAAAVQAASGGREEVLTPAPDLQAPPAEGDGQ
jgi:hypothetical protein